MQKRIKCFFIEETEKKIPRDIFDPETGAHLGSTEDTVYARTDTGEEFLLKDRPVGAIWFAPWLDNCYCAPQLRHTIVIRTPGGDWIPDSQSSNCTMPEDPKCQLHHCWIIEGSLERIESLTVSKNGRTCGAGAGSILIGKYHGFLRGGHLEEC